VSRPSRRRLPWEKDPADKEANYRRPIAQSEKIRLTAKAAVVVAGFLFVMGATRDRSDVGAEFAIGIGAPLVVAGVLDVVWTMKGQLEHVFLESRPVQLAAHSVMALVGVALVAGGLIAKGT
jgi:hypothetical protein